MIIRRALFAAPILLALFLIFSFSIARVSFDKKVNQLILSSIGDAEKLNPILSIDSASSDINSLVFNGLVKYNENLELAPDLAQSWSVEQLSTFYLKPSSGLTPASVIALLKENISPKESDELKIKGFEPRGERGVVVLLTTAGRAFEDAIFKVIAGDKMEEIKLYYIELDLKKSFPDGAKINAQELRRRIEKAVMANSLAGAEILEFYIERSNLLTVKILGDDKEVLELVKGIIGAGAPKKDDGSGLGRVANVEAYQIDNSPVITFYLRKGVKWHDGAPFTAEDVKFTYEKVMDERTNTVRRPLFELVKSVDIVDPYTVKVVYKKPFSPSFESWGLGVIPKHLLERDDINTARFNRRPVGTGPFKFKEWQSDEKITLVAYDSYFEGRPYLDQISYRIIPEPPLKELEFFIKGVDLDSPQPHQYERYAEDRKFKVYSQLANAYTYIGWNQKVDLFKDVRVRRALTHAINRKEIVKYLLYDLGVIATGPFPPQMWYYNPDVKPLDYDPAKSRALLAEAGWRDVDGDGVLEKDGKKFKFVLMTNNGNILRQNVAVLVQRQLKEVGIAVEIELYEWSVFIRDKINARNYEATVLGWSLGLDPDIYEIWHSSQIEKGFNFVSYSNSEVDRLIELGRTEYDKEKRKAIYYKIHEILNLDQPYTFLYVPTATPALHRGDFTIKRAMADGGAERLDEIEMTKNGLLYFLNKWIRTGGHLLSAQ